MTSSSTPDTITQTTRNDIPEWAVPTAQRALQSAETVAQTPYSSYGPAVAPLTPEHELGAQLARDRAMIGAPDIDAARSNYLQTMRGDFLSPESNPYLDQTFDRAARGLTDQYRYATDPGITAMGVRHNALDNTGLQEYRDMSRWQLGRNLEDLGTSIYGGNYQLERGRQLAGLQALPQVANLDYQDAQALYGAGDVRRAPLQDQLQQAYQEYDKARLQPYQNLQFLGSMLGTSVGNSGVSTAEQPYFPPSRAVGALGGGMAGFGLAQAFPKTFSNPWLPALAGGALGAFF